MIPKKRTTLMLVMGSCILLFFLQVLGIIQTTQWGFIPKNLTQDLNLQQGLRLITYIFLHGGLEHILYNMIFLWMFGNLITQLTGNIQCMIMIVLSGIGGALAHWYFNQHSAIPLIGASGSVMGLEGAYFTLAILHRLPHAEVWPLSRPVSPERLLLYAAIGLFFDLSSLAQGTDTGIAYAAHIGGFFTGAFIATMITPKRNECT